MTNPPRWLLAFLVTIFLGLQPGWTATIDAKIQSQVVEFGDNLYFSVVASGTGMLTYQWRKDGVNLSNGATISGATTDTLYILGVTPGDEGWYSVAVTDSQGSVTSEEARLTVVPVVAWGAGVANLGFDPFWGQSIVPVSLTNVVAIAAGALHSIALRADGTVVAWGDNSYGQLLVPPNLDNVVALAAGLYHSLALKADGRLVAWGDNTFGEATIPAGLSNVVAMAAGWGDSAALKGDGTVVAWGDNSAGQSTVPTGLNNVVRLAAGTGHYIALKADGRVVAWGWNFYGQATVPSGLLDVVAVAAGQRHSAVLRANGTVFAWGDNTYGMLMVPANLTNVFTISACHYNTLALKADGTVVGWGDNGYGQSTVPHGLTNVAAVAAGAAHSMVLHLPRGTLPRVVAQPRTQRVNPGNPTLLTISAVGPVPLSYLWFHDGVLVPNATNDFLNFPAVQVAQAGDYVCRVSNPYGSVTSAVISLDVPNISLPIALETTGLTWSNLPPAGVPWFGQSTDTHDGADAAQSGFTAHSQASGMAITVTGSGTITFWWNVSSEVGYDYLRFYTNGVEAARISGTNHTWEMLSFHLPEGPHSLQWVYTKDVSESHARDCGWVDEVGWTPDLPPNSPPVADPQIVTTVEDTAVSIVLTGSDPEVDPLAFEVVNLPAAGQLSGTPPNLTYTPNQDADLPDQFTFRTIDGHTNSPPATVTINITPVNDPPALGLLIDRTIEEGVAFSFDATATDPDHPVQPLSFSLQPGFPAGAVITGGGHFTWTPSETQGPSTNLIAVEVSDGVTNDIRAFTVVVSEVNQAPGFDSITDRTLDEGGLLTLVVSAADPDGPRDDLRFSLAPDAPVGMTIDAVTGEIRWTPDEAQGPATNAVTVRATDVGSPPATGTRTFQVIVREINLPPTLTSLDERSVSELTTLTFTNSATDPDLPANPLTFELLDHPLGLSVDPVSGVATWTPTEVQGPSTNIVSVKVTDHGNPAFSATNTVRVVVLEVNAAPAFEFLPDQNGEELSAILFTNTAIDPDLPTNALTYTLLDGPAGVNLDPITGAVSWTPSETQGPSTNLLTFHVADHGNPPLSATHQVTVIVREVNAAPVLDPIASQRVEVLKPLSLTLTAHDPDLPANTLRYELVAGPEGASIDPVTGLFSWTPTALFAGTNLAVTVRVVDNGTPPLEHRQSFPISVSGCAPGTMRILIDGVCYGPHDECTVTNAAAVRIESTFSRSVIFFTLDDSEATVDSPDYAGEFQVTQSVVIRARAFDRDSANEETAGPVQVTLLQAFWLITQRTGGGDLTVTPAVAPATNATTITYGPYLRGTAVQVTALAQAGWSFLNWAGPAIACGGNPDCAVAIDQDTTLGAVFGTPVIVTNVVNGTVIVNPAQAVYAYGTAVAVAAQPAPGYYLRFWQGTGLPSSPLPFTLVVTNPGPAISAIFSRLAANQLTLTALTEGPGSVLVNPVQNVYTNGQEVCVSAVESSPAHPFLGWTGLTNSSANPLCLTLVGSQTNYTVTARFSGHALPFWFSPASYAVTESNQVVRLTVQRDLASSASVGFRTVTATALAVDEDGWGDYRATNGVLTFGASDTTQTLSVDLRDNHSYQSNRVFSVELFDPTSPSTVYATALVTVVEDDLPSTDCSLLARKVEGGEATAASLQVVLEPARPEFRWRLAYEHGWRNSGDTVNLLPGDYDLRFKPVVGFEPPGWTTNGLGPCYLRVEAGLHQVTKPYRSMAAQDLPNGVDVLPYPVEVRSQAQWRLVGEAQWQSGEQTDVAVGEHLVEFSAVAGYVAPVPQTVVVGPSGLQAIAVEYTPAPAGSVAAHTLVELALANNSRYPYRFAGQITARKDSYGSGCAIKEKVVLTAAHVVYDPKALAPRAGVRWLHMGQGTGRDASLQPRGWVLWGSYSEAPGVTYTNQVAQEPVRGLATLRTRDVDVAALYFLSPAARGWYSGYLVSGTTACATNHWLEATNNKLLVGFPNLGLNFGRMYELGPKTNGMERMANADYRSARVYGTTGLVSFEGNSGAPLCVDAGNGVYYPAAVYLGVTDGRGLYAAIDSEAVTEVINKADYLADTGRSHGGGSGGPPEGVFELPDLTLGELTVELGPAGALAAGARWSLVGLGGPYTNNHTVPFMMPGSYEVTFQAAGGYGMPTNRWVTVQPGQGGTVPVVYPPLGQAVAGFGAWVVANGRLDLSITGGIGSTWVLEASTNLADPVRYGFRPVQTNLLDGTGRWEYADTNVFRLPERFLRLRQ